ncbi:mannan-binding lectin serine protease 2-like [Lampetra fluviatilis]
MPVPLLLCLLATWACGSPVELSAPQGEFCSPGFPGPYPGNETRVWQVRVSPSHAILFNFTHIHLPPLRLCRFIHIKVHAGGQLVKTLCGGELRAERGQRAAGVIRVLGHEATVTFTASGGNRGRFTGFCVHYRTTGLPCGQPLPIANGRMEMDQYSSVRYTCNEPYYSMASGNGQLICNETGQWVDEMGSPNLPGCKPVCGLVRHARSKRIIGGRFSHRGDFPWLAMLLLDNHFMGAGALLGDSWILTAAEIFTQDYGQVDVYLGLVDRRGVLANDSAVMKVHVESVVLHPNFSRDEEDAHDHDVALLRLTEPVPLRKDISPICLPGRDEGGGVSDQPPGPGHVGYVAGWGRITTTKLHGATPRWQRYVALPVVAQDKCRRTYADMEFAGRTLTYTDNMFCAGVPGGGRDACKGDSGGPFAYREPRSQRWVAAGITSWGVGCGQKGHYGVYTNVSNYVAWIEGEMQQGGKG